MATAFIDPKIYQALYTHISTATGFPAIVQPGETYPSDPTLPFILIDDVRLDATRRTVDSGGFDFLTGIFSCQVMTPLTWTHTQRLGIAGQIAALFAKGVVLTFSDVTVRMRKSPQPFGNGYRDDAFYRLPVNVYWECVG